MTVFHEHCHASRTNSTPLISLPHNRFTLLAAGAAAPSLSHQEQHHLTLPSCSTAHHTLTPQHAHLHRGPEALPLTHHNHIYSRHPTAFSCSSSVPCHNHTLLKGRICPPLLKIPPILPRTAHLSHICFFECTKTNEHTSSTTRASVGHPARAETARAVAKPPRGTLHPRLH